MIEVNDHGTFARAAKALMTQADKLQADLADATVKSADEVKENVKRSIASILPSRGGLAAAVQHLEVRVDRKSNGARIQASHRYNIARMNDGTVVHSVYGNPRSIVSQRIQAGFWDKAIKVSEPVIQKAIEKSMDESVKRIEKG
jgi:hypothetical protein